MRKLLTSFSTLLFYCINAAAQQTFPVNGIPDERNITYAFTHAHIVQDYKTVIENGMMVIRKNKIVAIGSNITIPPDAVVLDLKGKYIYPSLIDMYTDYGIPPKPNAPAGNRSPQFLSNTAGAYDWNQAIKPETEGEKLFAADAKQADEWRKLGFGLVLSFQKDGIARGTATIAALADDNENDLIIRDKAASMFSFDKGSSTQDYPSSLMGSIALMRQTFYDAEWYRNSTDHEYNISLAALNKQRLLPQIFEASNYLNVLRADKIGDEFNINFIIKGGGDEYKNIEEIKKAGNSLIIPLKFPDAENVNDPYDALNISLAELKHWELAPANSVFLEKAGIRYAITLDGLKDKKDFLKNIQKSISLGLTKEQALKALTYTPADLLGIANLAGSLKAGMLADFIITSKDLFEKDNILFENWVLGKRYIIRKSDYPDLRGKYQLTIDKKQYILRVNGDQYNSEWNIEQDSVKNKIVVAYSGNLLTLQFELKGDDPKGYFRLNGLIDVGNTKLLKGTGQLPNGNNISWQAVLDSAYISPAKTDTTKKETPKIGEVWYPNMAYGAETIPRAKAVLIKNATVWTNEQEGILENTDVLINNGKIAQVGKNISSTIAGLEIVDGKGKYVTSGIIDEHSHIAASDGLNEGTQSNSAEVRVADVIDCNDINIYRQLAGGVTSSHILHGSANAIGGQTQLIKLRWGKSPEEMKFKPWDGFIKFALGENVKQSHWGDNQVTRYPQTRMGVEQVYLDAFTRARAYENKWKQFNGSKDTKSIKPRRDLELDAMVEILNKKRFITCHSYIQSEINMLMHVADSFHFTVNTFTHILEGYKVADKMKKHGAGASTFSDWWAYKYEVMEPIPYNMYLMTKVGIVTAVNSDDAEMARRLNQEAAKSVKYGGLSEEDAWKMCTLNPAKLLHVDDRVGSIKVGKDADVVLWNNNPLSIYAHPLKTFVDGVCYYDAERDAQLAKQNATERQRLIQKMMLEKNKPGGNPPVVSQKKEMHCNDNEKPYEY